MACNSSRKSYFKTSNPRATIAHRRSTSTVTGQSVFVFCVFFGDLIKIEDAGVGTPLKIDLSNIQGQLTLMITFKLT